MKRCIYCGKEHDETAKICTIDRQPVVEVCAPQPNPSADPSVAFLRLLFRSPKEEELAIRCAEFLAGIAGDRIGLLRPDTKWSEIIEWLGPRYRDGVLLALLLKKKFGVDPEEVLANPEFTTFRDLVQHVSDRECKTT